MLQFNAEVLLEQPLHKYEQLHARVYRMQTEFHGTQQFFTMAIIAGVAHQLRRLQREFRFEFGSLSTTKLMEAQSTLEGLVEVGLPGQL